MNSIVYLNCNVVIDPTLPNDVMEIRGANTVRFTFEQAREPFIPQPSPIGGRVPPSQWSRFCPACGHLGNIPDNYLTCCPDGVFAAIVPHLFAWKCRENFDKLEHKKAHK